MERNKESLLKAEKVLKNRGTVVSTDIVKDKQYFQDSNKTQPLKRNSVDIAIASGVLTYEVLKRSDAKAVFKKMSDLIKVGGFLILSGLQEPHLNSKDLKEAGFKVINTSHPEMEEHFYLAQKERNK